MAKFYLFSLPRDVLTGIEPFRIDQPELAALDLSDSSDSSDSSSSDSSSSEDDIYKPATQSSTGFSLTVTKYNDEYADESMQSWKWANRAHITGSPFAYFSNAQCAQIGPKNVLSVYKSWFDSTEIAENPVKALKTIPQGQSLVLLVGSGHFAGAVINHTKLNHKSNISNPLQNVNIIASKTFHRYTVRRKQGGAQSSKDNATGKANSAGSTIRRSNERMLEQEVHALLEQWKPLIAQCYRVFVSAPGRSNRKLIMGYQNAPIAADDSRVFKIPFATKRPTSDECRHVWYQLTQAEVVPEPTISDFQTEQQRLAEKFKQLKEQKNKNKQKKLAKVSEKDDEDEDVKTSLEIVDLIKRSKLPALKTVLLTKGFDFRLQPASKYVAFPTPLLYAAHLDKPACVASLLEWGADLMIKNGLGASIGELAKPKTAQTLQIARKSMGEDAFNWNKAKVGKPMTRTEIMEREKKEKQQKQEELDKVQRELEEKEKKAQIEKLVNQHGAGHALHSTSSVAKGLTESELRQVERERRARAAEARCRR